MANDFSGDANCVALYTFENDWPTSGTLDDEGPVGTNDMSDNNTVVRANAAYESLTVPEQTYYADFTAGNQESFNISDASLSAGFPGKSSGGSVDFTICWWGRVDNTGEDRCFVGKYYTTGSLRTFLCRYDVSDGGMRINIGYSSGTLYVTTNHGGTIAEDTRNHFTIIYDDTGGADGKGNIKLKIQNSSGVLKDGLDDYLDYDTGQNISLMAADLCIGARDIAHTNSLAGQVDEMVFFKTALTIADCDDIYAGTYGASSGLSIPIAMYHYRQMARN